MFPPRWFLPYDAAFQLITAFVALAVALYALHGYRWIRERTLYALFLAFLLLSIGLFINGITLSYSYATGVTFSKVGSSSLVADVGFWAYYLMSMVAYSLLVYAYAKRLRESTTALAAGGGMGMGKGGGSGGVGISLVAAGPVMELVLVILLLVVLIAQLAHLTVKRNRYSITVTVSFALLLASHILFMFSSIEDVIYVVGRAVELTGFISLLAVLIGLRGAR